MAAQDVRLNPVTGKSRIEVLDIMRGIAILGILYMNIPYMGSNFGEWMSDPRRMGWSDADAAVYSFIRVFWNGTQRGMFELLFGAGVMVLTAKAMQPDGPVAIADLYLRRNLWLFVFGLIDIFVIGWVGDILLIYGLAALFVFTFRKLSPGVLIACGLLYAAATMIGWPGGGGAVGYQARGEMIATAQELETKAASGKSLDKEDQKKLDAWQARVRMLDLDNPIEGKQVEIKKAAAEAAQGSPAALLAFNWATWSKIFGSFFDTVINVSEAACTMLIGMALWKLGVIQGARSLRFYLGLALAGYATGCGLRIWELSEAYSFTMDPKLSYIPREPARLLVTVGHIGLFNAMVKLPATKALLTPFKAAGRMAFTIYIGTSVLTLWFVFAPWGLGLWDTMAWAQLALLATAINAGMLIFANVWLRYFACGPLEWAWRSLSYGKLQKFRHASAGLPQPPLPGLEPGTA